MLHTLQWFCAILLEECAFPAHSPICLPSNLFLLYPEFQIKCKVAKTEVWAGCTRHLPKERLLTTPGQWVGLPSCFLEANLLLPWEIICAGAKADGRWSCWSSWSACRAGTQERRRECNNPAPQNGGASCPGGKVQTRAC